MSVTGVHRLIVAAMMAGAASATAQPYPAKPLRIVTAAAGGGSDHTARMIAMPLGPALGQQVIVDNRGLLAADVAAKAPPDGYTLLVSGQTLWLLPFMRDNVASSISDFTPITTATQAANILVVHPTVPARSVRELVSLAHKRPGDLNYATSGNGNSVHLAGEVFKAMARVDVVRVNYKAGAQAVTDLVAGQTQFMFGVPASVTPHVSSGRLRALAITSEKRSALWPHLPAIAQTLPGYDVASRLAVFAPAGTPGSIVKRLNEEIVRILQRPEVKEKLVATGIEPVGDSPEALAATVKSEMDRMGKIIKAAGIRAD
jgi:tripartite-type tricarboxylate transporter receptor subunit TctC